MAYQQHSLVPVDGGWIVAHRFAALPEPSVPPSFTASAIRCLLITPIGMAAESIDPLARALASEGLEVVTFDLRNHVGESTGEPVDFLLSSAIQDCRAMVATVRPMVVAAIGIAARVAARVLADTSVVDAAVLLSPVVDIAATLEARRADHHPNTTDGPSTCFFESGMNRPEIWADAEELDLTSYESTLADLERFGGELRLIAGSEDPCVNHDQVAALTRDLPGSARIRTIEANRHLLHADIDVGSRMVGALIDEIALLLERPASGMATDQSAAKRSTSARPMSGTRSASLTASSRA